MPSYEDTFYVGNMKGVGRIYQQTFIDAIFHLNYKRFKEQLNRTHRFGRLGAGYLAGGHRTDNGR
jgi:hypothetical protein